MITEREIDLCRTGLAHLREAAPYLIPEARLRSSMRRGVTPAASPTEADNALRHLRAEACILEEETPEGLKYGITDPGRAWLKRNP